MRFLMKIYQRNLSVGWVNDLSLQFVIEDKQRECSDKYRPFREPWWLTDTLFTWRIYEEP